MNKRRVLRGQQRHEVVLKQIRVVGGRWRRVRAERASEIVTWRVVLIIRHVVAAVVEAEIIVKIFIRRVLQAASYSSSSSSSDERTVGLL